MKTKGYITVIERYQNNGLVAYSVDRGKTFHATTYDAFKHHAEVTNQSVTVPDTTTEHHENATTTDKPVINKGASK